MTMPPSYAPLTGSLVTFCKGVQAVLQANIAELVFNALPAKVFYGEQERYPTVPSYCVEPVSKTRELVAMQRIYELTFTCQIIGYLTQVQLGDQVIREQVDRLGETAETILHRDHTLGGLVRDLVVTGLESGYAYKEDTKYKAVILTVEAQSREGLPC